jgi:hypothetical protein
MSEIVFPFFRWCDSTVLSTTIRGSTYIFAVVETIHIIAVALMLGSIATMNLRLLGLGMRRQPVPRLAEDLSPFMWGGFWVVVLTGVPLFMAEALKCFGNAVFLPKMAVFFAALILSLTLHRKMTESDEAQTSPWLRKPVAVLSIVLWLAVAAGGRAIAFV